MRKIALMALVALPLFAGFFPDTVYTSVLKTVNKSIVLNSPFPVNGMSGVIIHNYNNELKAITHRIVQKSANKIVLINSDIIHHDQLPTIKTPVTAGDKVIGGYLYDNLLLLAPDAQTYNTITSTHANKTWIHPDLFAMFLSKIGDNVPTRKNLAAFARSYQVGLIYIVSKGKAKLLDPLSGYIVGQKVLAGLPAKGNSPFFMHFKKIKSGLFTSDNTKSYYQIMDNL